MAINVINYLVILVQFKQLEDTKRETSLVETSPVNDVFIK